MTIDTIKNELLGEKYYKINHPSGLTILVLTKPGYAGTSAMFSAKYGSIDTAIVDKNGDIRKIPEGTAHYLEHKLFESEDLDAFELFAKTGAYSNAFTSFDRTTYLFNCSANFKENLKILLNFVQSPYFTEQTVRKEQGIIGQEIRMYKDIPDWEIMFNLLSALFYEHPVKIDIAGTEESISRITADILYDCYNNFYNLNNMVLAVAGNVTLEDVLDVADKELKPSGGAPAKRVFVKESPVPIKKYVEEKLPVAVPQFLLGFKEDIKTPERSLKESLCTVLIHDVIMGRSSPLYKRMLEEELINNGFSDEFFSGFGYACCMFGGESKDPQRAADEIRKEIARVKKEGIDAASFERVRKKMYGGLVMEFNDVEAITQNLIDSYMDNTGLFDEIGICRSLTVDDVNERLQNILVDEYSALSVIIPVKGE
ncbi:MAG: insulinase family protein [Clostridiales bacterium]|nr:insulinase family protein [Clostridiales bacterium]